MKHPYLLPLFLIAAALVMAAVVMLLWNAIIPGLTGWALLTYPKALGLLVLCRILFGGFRGGRHSGPSWGGGSGWRARWKHMSEEERNALRERWRERCERR